MFASELPGGAEKQFLSIDKGAAMQTAQTFSAHQRYERCIEASKRIRWDIDRDVIQGREFDFDYKFLPDGLSLINELAFLNPKQKSFMSQVQGREFDFDYKFLPDGLSLINELAF